MVYADATPFQRIQMIEEALEKVLNRGPELSVESLCDGQPMHLFVIAHPYTDERAGHSLHQIARGLEVLLP